MLNFNINPKTELTIGNVEYLKNKYAVQLKQFSLKYGDKKYTVHAPFSGIIDFQKNPKYELFDPIFLSAKRIQKVFKAYKKNKYKNVDISLLLNKIYELESQLSTYKKLSVNLS